MRTVVRACIRLGKREDLLAAAKGPDCPAELRKAFVKGRYEGDICYFTVGGLFGNPWPQLKPWIETYFEIEWEHAQRDVDREELARIGKLHTLRAKLGLSA
jgi:hypothetical protein